MREAAKSLIQRRDEAGQQNNKNPIIRTLDLQFSETTTTTDKTGGEE